MEPSHRQNKEPIKRGDAEISLRIAEEEKITYVQPFQLCRPT